MANYDFDILRTELEEVAGSTNGYDYGVNSLALFIDDAISSTQSLYERIGDSVRVEAMVDGVYNDMFELRARVIAANTRDGT